MEQDNRITLSEINDCNLCTAIDSGLWIGDHTFWKLGVCPYQHTLGTLVIVNKTHKELFPELTQEEVTELRSIVIDAYSLLKKHFSPDWFNLQQNGNWEHHLHFQIIPRYKAERSFGGRDFFDQHFSHPVEYTKQQEDSAFIGRLTQIFE